MESKRNLNGERPGDLWMPPEMPVSIRKGWFYHDSESPKPLPELRRIWLESIGRGANLLLNLAPDRRGRIADADRKALAEFRRWREKSFGTNLLASATLSASNVRGGSEKFGPGKVCDNDPETFWGTDDNMESAEVIADFGKEAKFNRVKLGEYLPLGQRIDKFGIDAWAGGKWWLIGEGTSIGNCRIVSFKTVSASKVRLRIAKASACPALSDVGVYLDESP
jgi:alpha-L-fucosidase